tara:strand:- start:23909 stop:24166 length:258 start_codon:yes stop_codon:yes gene_type:complete
LANNIPWKKHDLYFEFDGDQVHAEIIWWAKDYYILIKKPYEMHLKGLHMMYMIPAKFVIEIDPKDKLHQVPILDTCKSMIMDALS